MFDAHPFIQRWIVKVGDITRGENVRLAGAQTFIYEDAVGNLDSGRAGQSCVRDDTDPGDDMVSQDFLAALGDLC